MNKRVKKLWIEALRSGNTPQAEGALRRGEARCCLGVLCDVFKKDTGRGKWERAGDSTFHFVIDDERNGATLPQAVQKWAALKTDNPKLGREYAAPLNDYGTPFKDIADRIEKHL